MRRIFWSLLALFAVLSAPIGGRAASVNGTTIPPTTAIEDSGDNVWTVSGRQIYRNGVVDPVTANVTLLLYYHGTIYQQTSPGAWYQLNTTNWPAGGTGWMHLNSGDPRTPSPSGATIPSATEIVDTSQNVWVVSGGQIYQNGLVDPITANVTLLLYYNGIIYQETSSGAWYQLNTTKWPAGATGWTYRPSGDPRTASCAGVSVAPGASLQNVIKSNPAGTTFCLSAGTWSGQVFTAKSDDQFIGAGAGETILDGTGTSGRMTDGWDNGVTGVVIDGLTVAGYEADQIGTTACANGGGWPQVTTGNGWIIRNSIFQNSGCTGVFIAGSATLTNNRFTNHMKSGVFCYVNIPGAGTTILVEGNEIDHNNQGHYAQDNTPAGIKCYAELSWPSIQTVSVLNNYVHDNVATGIWLDTNIKNAMVQGNTVVNNSNAGIGYEVSPGPCDISHNVINGNGAGPFYTSGPSMGIFISTSSNCKVHDNNVFSPTGSFGPIYMQTDTRNDAPSDAGRNVNFYNNTITFASNGTATLLYGFTNNSRITPTGSYSNNNSFYDTAGTSNPHWLWNTTPYVGMTWSNYRSATGQDAGSTLRSGNASVSGCTQVGCTGSGW
jgi:hypothetical protein